MASEMREATFAILTSLADGPRHGYGIIREVAEATDGRIRLLAGTLYAALERLRVDGLVAVDHEEVVQGRLRRFYRLTDDGAAQLRVAAEQRAAAAERALARLGTPPLRTAQP